jgi:hypothetical protein
MHLGSRVHLENNRRNTMDNQHRKIAGYRELSQPEIDLMNEIKALGLVIEDVIIKVGKHIDSQVAAVEAACNPATATSESVEKAQAEIERLEDATPSRFQAAAKADFQTALMLLTRAVAQPTFF